MAVSETEHRRDAIIALLRERGDIPVAELAAHFAVSAQTLRSDLRLLAEARIVRRRYGVACLEMPGDLRDAGAGGGQVAEEKARIARAVAAEIPDGATVALGTGTTVEAVARALLGHRGLTVATNNLQVAFALRGREDLTLLLAGGEVRMRELDVVGPDSLAFFGGLNFDHAVFSVAGMGPAGDLLDFTAGEVQARKAITACARQRTLVIDSTKIGRGAPFSWGRAAELDRVVTGGQLPDAARAGEGARACRIVRV